MQSALPMSAPSHSSPSSRIPLPQNSIEQPLVSNWHMSSHASSPPLKPSKTQSLPARSMPSHFSPALVSATPSPHALGSPSPSPDSPSPSPESPSPESPSPESPSPSPDSPSPSPVELLSAPSLPLVSEPVLA